MARGRRHKQAEQTDVDSHTHELDDAGGVGVAADPEDFGHCDRVESRDLDRVEPGLLLVLCIDPAYAVWQMIQLTQSGNACLEARRA